MTRGLAIDMGTATTTVYLDGRGVVVHEPSAVAVDPDGVVRYFGSEALARTPHSRTRLELRWPLQNGAIADFEATEGLIRFLFRTLGVRRFSRVRFVGCIPAGVTPIEQRALSDAAHRAGAAEVRLIEQPLAVAIGAGLPIHEPLGSMVVNLGAGTTETAVVSLGSVVASSSIRIGSGDIDEAIRLAMRRRFGTQIPSSTATQLKEALGTAVVLDGPVPRAEVTGWGADGTTPRSVVIDAHDLHRAMDEPLRQMIDSVRECMIQTSPEMAHDLITNGIALAGGGALLPGVAARLSAETGLDVHTVDDPITCAARGAGRCLDAFDTLGALLVAT